MDAELAKNWRELIMPDDEVWLLGDICMGDKDKSLPLLASLPGTKHLITGNHDDPFRKPEEVATYLQFFDSVQDSTTLTIGNEIVNLCHFPYLGADRGRGHSDAKRFRENRLIDDGRILICGHVHEAWKTKDRMLNVGVDMWNYYPVSEDQIRETISQLRRV
jgi:calcineurin-like phosphoesterase family protein